MRKITIALIMMILLMPKESKAQDRGAVLPIGEGIAAKYNMKESAEWAATQWIVGNHPEMQSFSLKTLDFNGKKAKDMAAMSAVTFRIQEFSPANKPALNGKRQVLFCFTSNGWINAQGQFDLSKVKWFLIDSNEWMNMMVAFSKVSSSESDLAVVKEKLTNGVLGSNGVKVKGDKGIPFFKLENDMYLVTDYSPEMKLIYNQKSLCVFLKETGNMVQMERDAVVDTHNFYFGKG